MDKEKIVSLKSYDEKTGNLIGDILPITSVEAVKIDTDKNLNEKLVEIDSGINDNLTKIDEHLENHPQGFSGNYEDLVGTPEIPDISGLATKEEVNTIVTEIPDISGLATKEEVNAIMTEIAGVSVILDEVISTL